jgi:hypothetical protein
MNKHFFVVAISFLVGGLIPACKKDMPQVVAARWAAMEDLARAAGPVCDRVLAQPQCPLEPDHLPHPEASAIVRLPASPLVGATEVRQVEVFCEAKAQGQEEPTHSCYLQHYFDPHSPQRDAAWTCDRAKPYPGWEHAKEGLGLAYGQDCHENLYHASLLRHSPAGNTVHARVHFYVDGHAPAVAPIPAPQ